MFTRKNLQFPHKAVLTRGMLQEIYDSPREFFRLMYEGFSDGIICGLNYFVRDGALILSAGVFRLQGELYFLAEDFNLSALAEKNNLNANQKYAVTFKKISRQKEQCIEEIELEPTFSAGGGVTLGEFRFFSADGFYLPELASGDDPFKNIFRSGVFNLLEVPAAAREEATFHPQLFKIVREFLSTKKNRTPFDCAILVQLQSGEIIPVETIRAYISAEKGSCDFKNRRDLFRAFCDCLISAKFTAAAYKNSDAPETQTSRPRRSEGKLI